MMEPIKKWIKVPLDGEDLVPVVVEVLQKLGGSAESKKVEQEIYRIYSEKFKAPDFQRVYKGGVPKWKKYVQWARDKAKKAGFIKKPEDSGRGIWELTEEGRNMKF